MTDDISRRNSDFDDLQNEIAGREVGRVQRFLSLEEAATRGKSQNKGIDAITLSALETLLQDPEYAKLYNEVSDLLSRAESATEAALAHAENDLSKANADLEETMENANRLPDGTAVFRDAQGRIVTEDGRVIEGEEAEGIVWKDNAPSYEDFLAKKRAAEAVRQRVEDLRRYQVEVLGHARDRLNDHDNPPTPEELADLQQDIIQRAPPEIRTEIDPEMSAEDSKPVSRDVSLDVESPPI